MKPILWLPAAALLFVLEPAHAFWGIGDVVYNPTEYGQFGKTIEQGKQLYDASVRQLDSLASIERSMNEANQAYQNLRTLNLSELWQNLQPGMSLHGTTTPIATLRAEIANSQNGVTHDAGYIRYQLQQLDQLDRLAVVQQASAGDNQKASATPQPAQSAQITAASTSALAALAASEERRRTEQDFARASAQQGAIDHFNDTSLYDAIGGGARASGH